MSQDNQTDSQLRQFDISHELWREYDFPGRPEAYRINQPKELYIRPVNF